MHIDWNWIKQRPHFIAEELEQISNIQVIILYRTLLDKKLLIDNTQEFKTKPRGIPRLPLSRFSLISHMNRILENIYILTKVHVCNMIYITHPSFFPAIKNIKNKNVIYDCMDDSLSFPLKEKTKRKICIYEKGIVSRAFLTIFSAKYLQKVVQMRCNFSFPSIVLNNAISLPLQLETKKVQLRNLFATKRKKIISYIGTISEYLDYEILITITRKKNMDIYLFGPIINQFPPERGITFYGPQDHDDIFFIMDQSDVLIMPFKLSNLIKSVNPVKLYEYIYSGKPVISVKYDETIYFEDFVYLYNAEDPQSIIEILDLLEENNFKAKKNRIEMRQFAFLNTWEERMKTLIKYIV
jgi:glycosyltransferase involved in cell wall biosynthesis